MMGGYIVFSLFVLLGVFRCAETDANVTVKEGDSVTLNSSVTKQRDQLMMWYFKDTRIALINGEPSTSRLYDGEGGRFRDRLDVDYKTGSLTIRDITTEHAGRYKAELNKITSSGTSEILNREKKSNSKTNPRKTRSTNDNTPNTFIVYVTGSGVSAGVVTGVVVGVLLLQLLV